MARYALFVINATIALVVGALFHDDWARNAVMVAAYALAYLVPDQFDEYRGAFFRNPSLVISILVGLGVTGQIVHEIARGHGMEYAGRVTGYIFDAMGAFVAGIAFDRFPPRDKSKKSKIDDAVKNLVEKVARIHGTPAPAPART